jgi:hypothetical protein
LGVSRRFWRFTFEREAYWLLGLCVLVPLVLFLLLIVIPAFMRCYRHGALRACATLGRAPF